MADVKVNNTIDQTKTSVSEADAIKKLNSILNYTSSLSGPPKFRKSYSTLSSYVPFVDLTIEIPKSNNPADVADLELFAIPYNNIKSFNLKTIGGTSNIEVKFDDSTFTVGIKLVTKLFAIANSADFGGTPILKVRWGWVATQAPPIRKREAQPVYENVANFRIEHVENDESATYESFTLKGTSFSGGPIGIFAARFKPFLALGKKPLTNMLYGKFFGVIKTLIRNDGETSKLLRDVITSKQLILSGKNIGKDVQKFRKKIVDGFGVNEELEVISIAKGLFAIRQANQFDVGAASFIDAPEVKPIGFKENTIEGRDPDPILALTSSENFKIARIKDIFATSNEKVKKLLNYVLPVANEARVNPAIAFSYLLREMFIQNEQINKEFPDQNNKIFLINLIKADQIESIKKIIDKKGDKISLKKNYTDDPFNANFQDVTKDIEAKKIDITKFTNWNELLTEMGTRVILAPDVVKANSKDAPNDTSSKNSKSIQVFMNTYNYDKFFNQGESKVFEGIINLLGEIHGASNDKTKPPKNLFAGLVERIKSEAKNYKQFTLIILAEKNVGSIFASSNWGNRLIQTYTINPHKPAGDNFFNSGSVNMADSFFPDVISFKPKLPFETVMRSVLNSSNKANTFATANEQILNQANDISFNADQVKAKADAEKAKAQGKPTPIKQETFLKQIDANKVAARVQVQDLIDIRTPHVNPADQADATALNVKRSDDNLRKALGAAAAGMEADLEIMGEPAFDQTLVFCNMLIWINHFLPNGTQSQYTGAYTVNSSEHHIENGNFKTMLSLRRDITSEANSNFFGNDAFTSEAPPIIEKDINEVKDTKNKDKKKADLKKQNDAKSK